MQAESHKYTYKHTCTFKTEYFVYINAIYA